MNLVWVRYRRQLYIIPPLTMRKMIGLPSMNNTLVIILLSSCVPKICQNNRIDTC